MSSNKISGLVLSFSDSTALLPFLHTILHKLNFALNASSHSHLLSQTQTSWQVLACKHPDMHAYSVASAKKVIAADIVGMVEEYKKMKYEYAMNWPASAFKESIWSLLGDSLDMGGTIYNIRNWCSHRFGIKHSTIEEEKDMFEMLVKHYEMLRPLVEELVEKMEAALEDEKAWGTVLDVNDMCLALGEGMPWYTKDGEAVQLQLALRQERFQAMLAERNNQLEEEIWEHVDVVEDGEWGAQCGEGLQDGQCGAYVDEGNDQYEVPDDDNVSSVSDDREDDDPVPLPTWMDYDEVHDSGYEDETLPFHSTVKVSSMRNPSKLWKPYRKIFDEPLTPIGDGLWHP